LALRATRDDLSLDKERFFRVGALATQRNPETLKETAAV